MRQYAKKKPPTKQTKPDKHLRVCAVREVGYENTHCSFYCMAAFVFCGTIVEYVTMRACDRSVYLNVGVEWI